MQKRTELTFLDNRDRGRHGWLRLTPAYSVRLVDALLRERPAATKVLDPFSGTGTTPLSAVSLGREAVSLDVNPFLVWLGNAKLARYDPRAREQARSVARAAHAGRARVAPPPIHNVSRWWAPETLEALCRIKAACLAGTREGTRARDLLMVAFCRLTIESSGAAFNHPSMSFGQATRLSRRVLADRFVQTVEDVLESARRAPRARGRVLLGDARTLESLEDMRFDLVITSPPYPNRMSYVRELRPYMYWTDFLSAPRDAGELDWRAIGGTWGIATSRLATWDRDPSVDLPPELDEVVHKLSKSAGKNAALLARYVCRYFEDTARHLRAIVTHLSEGAEVHYIVGNSKFYDVLVPSEQIYARLMEGAGLRRVRIETLRKRNSKKELYEYDVTARLH